MQLFPFCFAILIVSKTSYECGQEHEPFVFSKVIKEFVLDATSGQKFFPANKIPRLLGASGEGNAFRLVYKGSSELMKEVISFGNVGDIDKGVSSYGS